MEIKSNNFNVDSKGNMECSNAKITNGEILLENDSSTTSKFKIKNSSGTVENLITQNRMWVKTNNNKTLIMLWANESEESSLLNLRNGTLFIQNSNGESKITGEGSTGNLTCVTLTQTSLAEQKKNFEKLQDNALETIKGIDIYKYNLKNEKDTDKKHIGFIIGDNYNYSKEVTSIDNQGVDNYSFTSLCCKAIQELTAKIEELENKIEEMEGK